VYTVASRRGREAEAWDAGGERDPGQAGRRTLAGSLVCLVNSSLPGCSFFIHQKLKCVYSDDDSDADNEERHH
jgi:hypothetical protein